MFRKKTLLKSLKIYAYSRSEAADVNKILKKLSPLLKPELATSSESIFQICDEVIKNAFKANLKFLFFWLYSYLSIIEKKKVNDYLRVYELLGRAYSSPSFKNENELIKIFSLSSKIISSSVKSLLMLMDGFENRNKQNSFFQHSSIIERLKLILKTNGGMYIQRNPALLDLIIKDTEKFFTTGDIFAILFNVEVIENSLVIAVESNSLLFRKDFERIENIRQTFASYKPEDKGKFFIERIDLSGGGHGLGFAFVLSLLHELNVDPEKDLQVSKDENHKKLKISFSLPKKEKFLETVMHSLKT